jgi:uncharacterized protein YprB with RNaseH-like and TPR domain
LLSDEIRKRLKKLNRSSLRRGVTSIAPYDINKETAASGDVGNLYVAEGQLPQAFRKPAVIRAEKEEFIGLNEAISGEEINNSRGRFLLVRRQLNDFAADALTINSRYSDFFSKFSAPEGLKYLSRQLRTFLRRQPSRILYLDIETTGLWSTPLFLVGLMFMEGSKFCIHQLFAREYAEEAAVLGYLADFISGFDSLITFNGKSFDIRFIRDRSKVNMVDFLWDGTHLDLLHEGRRRYRKKFENCRLITLEERVCGRLRSGDIPGHQIPDEYHYFVRTGNACKLRNIFYHNGLDLITMAELLLDILSFKE